jgi:cytochrome b6-f complex iron-sulfur subunit
MRQEDSAMSESGSRTTRRGLIDWLIGICSTLTGIALIGPAVAYLWPVTKEGPVRAREDVGAPDDWAVWQGRRVSVASKPVLVIRTDRAFVAMSAVCTHLGCLVEMDTAKRMVTCPCHAAGFDLEGRVLHGPPPRPLALYSVSEVQGRIYVSA